MFHLNLDFDPEDLYGQVARQLLTDYGARAYGLAQAALERMRQEGDQEGEDIWREIHDQIFAQEESVHEPDWAETARH